MWCDMSRNHHGRDYTLGCRNEKTEIPVFLGSLRFPVLPLQFDGRCPGARSKVMKRILLIGDSGGIGTALKRRFEDRGNHVTGLSRRRDGFDVTKPAKAEDMLAQLEGPFDQIWVALGVLSAERARPEKALSELDAEEMAQVLAVNCLGPALVLKHVKRLMSRQGPAVMAALSARVGSIGDNRAGGWYSYRASKAALNQLVHTAAIELTRTHPQAVCVALHPGTVETAFTQGFPNAPKVSARQAAQNLIDVAEGLSPKQTGGFYDWQGESVAW